MSLLHWIWLSQTIPDPAQSIRLLEAFSKPERVYSAELSELVQTNILTPEQCVKLVASRSLTSASEIIRTCVEQNIRIISYVDAVYPERLRAIPDPPLLLYVRGSFPLFDETFTLSVVGTRHASIESLTTAERFSSQLSSNGFYIVSGMAAGIDSAANCGALNAGYQTAAVLGCGVDICYPPENRGLYDRIVAHGCLISEYPPGTRPNRKSFPRRNRIIAGLANAVLVISAPLYSGSLITAHFACDYGRKMFVIPGSIQDPTYAGSNQLLNEGAMPITSPQELLKAFRKQDSPSASVTPVQEAAPSVKPEAPSPIKSEPIESEPPSPTEGESTSDIITRPSSPLFSPVRTDAYGSPPIYPEYEQEKLRKILAESILPLRLPTCKVPFCFLVHYTDDLASFSKDIALEYLALYSNEPNQPHIDPVTRKRTAVSRLTIDWDTTPYFFMKYDGEHPSKYFSDCIEYDETGAIERIDGIPTMTSYFFRADIPAPLLKYIPDSLTPYLEPLRDCIASPEPATPDTSTRKTRRKSRLPVESDDSASINQPVSEVSESPDLSDIPPDCVEVYKAICSGISIPDHIIDALGMDVAAALAAMSKLEVLGFTRRLPGDRIVPLQN